jgi:hypothetical protein
MVRSVFIVAAVLAALFTAGWYIYMQQGAEDARFKNFLSAHTVLRPGQEAPSEVEAPSAVGLWVGGVATVVFLVAAAATPITGNRKKCPFCAEDIAVGAKVCKHCKRDLPVSG